MAVIKFGSKDSRIGDHSYTGWNEGYFLCDGTSHFEVNVPQGAFMENSVSCERVGDCDKKSCDGGRLVDVNKLSSAAQKALGILVPVPEGMLLVEQGSSPWLQSSVDFYRVTKAGEIVTPRRLAEGKLIAQGETAEVIEDVYSTSAGRHRSVKRIIRNLNGQPVVEDGEKEDRKRFARVQMEYLMACGFSQGRAYQIMKAAGPGQVQEAVSWAYKARDILIIRQMKEDGVVDALDCVLSGVGGTHKFGRDRMTAALEALELPVPSGKTTTTFYGVLAGAKEALLGGLPEMEHTPEFKPRGARW